MGRRPISARRGPTLSAVLRAVADRRGGKVAFRHGDRTLTYAELATQAERIAAVLAARGVRAGQAVGVAPADPLERIAVHHGVLAAGAVAVALNPEYRDELLPIVEDADLRAVVADAPLLARLAAGPRRVMARLATGPEPAPGTETLVAACASAPPPPQPRVTAADPAVAFFTSGTTGRPKGVVHTHAAVLANLAALRESWAWTAADVCYLPVVLFHVHGLSNGVHGTILTGSTAVLPEPRGPAGFAADTLAMLGREGCTMFFGVPTHYERLVAHARAHGVPPLPAMRLWVSGSAPLPAATFAAFREAFGQAPLERYGMTETLMLTSNPLAGPRLPGAVGRPLPEVELRIADPTTGAMLGPGAVGEVWARGPSVFTGYAAAREPGPFVGRFFRTGDLGALDPDGVLRLTGRASDVIITGGMNVMPAEVEAALALHPAVRESAVVGVPDPDLGESVAAAVVLQAGVPVTPEDLIAHVRERLAPHKKPRRVVCVADLPRTPVGKVDRRAVRALCAAPSSTGGA